MSTIVKEQCVKKKKQKYLINQIALNFEYKQNDTEYYKIKTKMVN